MEEQSLIEKETLRYEEKVKEFQDYLEQNTVIRKIKNGKVIEADEANRYKEMDIQMKIMSNLPAWLEALKKLRDTNEKKVEIRGSAEVSGMFKK